MTQESTSNRTFPDTGIIRDERLKSSGSIGSGDRQSVRPSPKRTASLSYPSATSSSSKSSSIPGSSSRRLLTLSGTKTVTFAPEDFYSWFPPGISSSQVSFLLVLSFENHEKAVWHNNHVMFNFWNSSRHPSYRKSDFHIPEHFRCYETWMTDIWSLTWKISILMYHAVASIFVFTSKMFKKVELESFESKRCFMRMADLERMSLRIGRSSFIVCFIISFFPLPFFSTLSLSSSHLSLYEQFPFSITIPCSSHIQFFAKWWVLM